MGNFEDYIKQPVLFPAIVEEITTPLVRTKNRGKERAEAKESSSSELLVLMKEMREEMRIKDEQLREELRLRDNNQAAKK